MKKTMNQMAAKELYQRIADILNLLKNQGMAQKIKAAAASALNENNVSQLKSLLIIALVAECDEDLVSNKIDKEGLIFDPLSREYLSEFDPTKAIKELTATVDDIQAQLKKKIKKIDNKLDQ